MTDTQPGVVSSNGTAYGPPTTAFSWGSSGCPILPASIRQRFRSVEVPANLSQMFGMTLTYDQLDSEILQRSNLDNPPRQVRNIVRDVVNKMSFLPLDEVVIPAGIPLSWLQALPINPRTRNAILTAFRKRGENKQLSSPMSVTEFLSIRGVGVTMSIELLCVIESAYHGRLGDMDPAQIDEEESESNLVAFEWAVEQASQRRMEMLSPLVEPIQRFAGWAQAETNAETLGEAIDEAMSRDEFVHQWNRVAGVSLASLSTPPPHPYVLLDSWSEKLEHREAIVLRDRISCDEPSTLEEMAQSFGVSRERVRQIQARVQQKLRRFLAGEAARPIHWRAETLRKVLGVAGPCRIVERLLEAPSGNKDYRTILLDIAGPYAMEGNWLIHRASQSDDPTASIRLSADEFGRIDLEVAASELSAWGLDASLHREWVTRDSTIREFNGVLASWGASVGDRLAFALADLGRIATIDELMGHIQEARSRGSAQNALGSDQRVVKVDQNRYALRSWGFNEFKNIAHAVRDLIQEAGHPLSIDAVVDRVTRTFGVAETSVRQYVHAPIFVVHGDVVRLRTGDEPFRYPGGSIRRTPGVYALGPRRVSLMRRVDADLLRGSGRILTYAAGDVLGVEVNGRVTLTNGEGDSIVLTYPETSIVGPSIGSVRALAERLSAKIGDYMTLIMDRSDLSVAAQVTRLDVSNPSWDLVSRLTGIDVHRGMDDLAEALQCDQTEVRSILRSRGDEVVLEALPAQSASSSLSRALTELGDQIRKAYGSPS